MKTTFLKWMVVVGGACAATAVIHPRLAQSADHRDAPLVTAEPGADINDVYAFMDANNVVLAMTVFPAAPAGAKFSDNVQYAIRTASGAGFGPTTNDTNIICTFTNATPQIAQCWVGADEYVTGDASAAAGITSASGKVKIFAGLRADPFFFNLDGFRATVNTVKTAAPGLVFDDAGCPNTTAVGGALATSLMTTDGGTAVDFFKTLNTLAIVASIDKTLVTKGGATVAVSGSTHRKP